MSKIVITVAWVMIATAVNDVLNDVFVQAAEAVKNSVVSISVYNKRGTGPDARYVKVAYGSGTVIENGYIVTNYHLVVKGSYYEVIFDNDDRLNLVPFDGGKMFLADPKTDIAVMKIRSHDRYPIAPIEFEDSDRVCEGEWVIAAGNPYGLHRTITTGVVSYRGRNDIGFADIEDFIQTDVPINPGNSGGPLVNLKGRLIGINTAIRTETGGYQGISFAIPSNIVRFVSKELIEHGRVRRGWIGFIVKEQRRGPGGEESRLAVVSVVRHSPAEAAGIKTGDIIREVDGERVHTIGGLIKAAANKPVGSRINITLSREGRLERVRMILRERTVYRNIRRGMQELFSRYGIEVDEDAGRGDVIVSYISPRAYGISLKRGDAVRSLNGRQITHLEGFVKAFQKAGGAIERMVVERDGRVFEVRFD